MPRGRKRKSDSDTIDDDAELKVTKNKKAVDGKSDKKDESLGDKVSVIKSDGGTSDMAQHQVRKNAKRRANVTVTECSVKIKKLSSNDIERATSPGQISQKPVRTKNDSEIKIGRKVLVDSAVNKNESSKPHRIKELSADVKLQIAKHAILDKKKNNDSKVGSVNSSRPKQSPTDVKKPKVQKKVLSESSGVGASVKKKDLGIMKNKVVKKEQKLVNNSSPKLASTDVKKQKIQRKALPESSSVGASVKKKDSNSIIMKSEVVKKEEKLVTQVAKKPSKNVKQKAVVAVPSSSKKITTSKKNEAKKSPVKARKGSDSSDSESDWEEVKEEEEDEDDKLESYNPEIPTEGVEITLEGPKIIKRRNKKSWDQMEAIRLYINRERKELQMDKHKTHLLCLIAHGMNVNNILNMPEVSASALSIVPEQFHGLSKKSARIELETIQKLFDWYREAFTTDKTFKFYHISVSKLCRGFELKKASNVQEFNMLFLVICRTLCIPVRLCLSLYPTSFKAKNLLKKPKTKENEDDVGNTSAVVAGKLMKAKLDKLLGDDIGTSSTDQNSDSKVKKDESEKASPPSKQIVIKTEEGEMNPDKQTKSKKKKSLPNSKPVKVKSPDGSALGRRPRRSFGKKSYKLSSGESDSNGSDDDFEEKMEDKSPKTLASNKKQANEERNTAIKKKSSAKNRKILSSDSENSCPGSEVVGDQGVEYWLEVYCKATKKWVSVECYNKIINKPYLIEKVVSQPISYIIALDNSSFVKDVTKRYCPDFLTETRKLRRDVEWWDETLQPFLPPNTKEDREEESQMEATLLTKPLPKTIGEYKNHPLYALKRHLLKFEALYPPDVQPLGFIRGEPVYPREAVRTLHSRENWVKEARMVRINEEPYKIVKARPKWDRFAGVMKTDLPLDIFGFWQTEEYIPPIAHNGKVPRNEYGNVELFKPCMLPIGTVHLQLPGLSRVCKKLGIDCATAVVGFDAHKGSMCPVYDGFVVCEEFQETVLDAWNEEQDNMKKREEEKREKRIYGNWKRLIRGLLIREKIKTKYNVD